MYIYIDLRQYKHGGGEPGLQGCWFAGCNEGEWIIRWELAPPAMHQGAAPVFKLFKKSQYSLIVITTRGRGILPPPLHLFPAHPKQS